MNEIVQMVFHHVGGRMVAGVVLKIDDGSLVEGMTTMAPDMATIVADDVNGALRGMLWHYQYPPAAGPLVSGPMTPDYGNACLMMAGRTPSPVTNRS